MNILAKKFIDFRVLTFLVFSFCSMQVNSMKLEQNLSELTNVLDRVNNEIPIDFTPENFSSKINIFVNELKQNFQTHKQTFDATIKELSKDTTLYETNPGQALENLSTHLNELNNILNLIFFSRLDLLVPILLFLALHPDDKILSEERNKLVEEINSMEPPLKEFYEKLVTTIPKGQLDTIEAKDDSLKNIDLLKRLIQKPSKVIANFRKNLEEIEKLNEMYKNEVSNFKKVLNTIDQKNEDEFSQDYDSFVTALGIMFIRSVDLSQRIYLVLLDPTLLNRANKILNDFYTHHKDFLTFLKQNQSSIINKAKSSIPNMNEYLTLIQEVNIDDTDIEALKILFSIYNKLFTTKKLSLEDAKRIIP